MSQLGQQPLVPRGARTRAACSRCCAPCSSRRSPLVTPPPDVAAARARGVDAASARAGLLLLADRARLPLRRVARSSAASAAQGHSRADRADRARAAAGRRARAPRAGCRCGCRATSCSSRRSSPSCWRAGVALRPRGRSRASWIGAAARWRARTLLPLRPRLHEGAVARRGARDRATRAGRRPRCSCRSTSTRSASTTYEARATGDGVRGVASRGPVRLRLHGPPARRHGARSAERTAGYDEVWVVVRSANSRVRAASSSPAPSVSPPTADTWKAR